MLWKKKCHMMETNDLIHNLLYATVSRDVNKVDELMQCGIDPCTPTKDGTSPIHKAALIESPCGSKIVSKMLSYGADPNVTTPTGLSPLHIAAMWGRVETIDVLLDNGANVSLKDIDDMSALDYTDEAEENREECIDALTRYRPVARRNDNDSPLGYSGEMLENDKSDILSDNSINECFWSSPNTPQIISSLGASPDRRKCINAHRSPTKEPRIKKSLCSPKQSKTRLFVPVTPHGCKTNSCNVSVKISFPNNCNGKYEKSDNSSVRDNIDGYHAGNDNQNLIKNLSNILLHDIESCCESYINLDSQNRTEDLETEATVNYSDTNRTVASLVQYYDEKDNEEAATVKEEIFDSLTRCKLDSQKLNVNDCDIKLVNNEEGMIPELALLNIEYDWKDISDIANTSILEGSLVTIPSSIFSLSDDELKTRLRKAGETPGPISDTTRKVYQKYLAKIEKNNGHPLQPNDKYKDYTPEMRQVLIGTLEITKESSDLLETEMAFKFIHPEKHTWREGTMKTSFNYLLLDPRVTNNLPKRATSMSYIENLRIFIASVFYIGKGKKSRPYEHLQEAAKYEKNSQNLQTPSDKINIIRDIWEVGFGVVSIHIFHSIIPVEAFTREACMIEAMGLPRLTNAKSGDFYGDAASWSGKKRRLLGIYILMKAMEIYLVEGERQIRLIDLSK